MKKKFKITFNAPVVLSFVGICLLVTALNYVTGGMSNQVAFMTYHSPLRSPMTWIRFVTHVFGHSSWSHFIGNTCYLLLLGPMLEEKYSSSTIAYVIGITAVVTGVMNYILFPGIALCGASGVVFAFILLSSFTGFKEGEIPLTFILVFVFFIGQQLYEGIAVQNDVSNMAHIVGGVIGGLLGYGLNKNTRFGR